MIIYSLYINGKLLLTTPSRHKINDMLVVEMNKPSYQCWHVDVKYRNNKKK